MPNEILVPKEKIEYLIKIVEVLEAQRKELLSLSKIIEAEVKKVYFARAKGLERTIISFGMFFENMQIGYEYDDGVIKHGELHDFTLTADTIQKMNGFAAVCEDNNIKNVSEWKEASEDTKGIYEKVILEKFCEYVGSKIFLYSLDLAYTYDLETGNLALTLMSAREKELFEKNYEIGNIFSEETQRAAGLYRLEVIRNIREKIEVELSKIEMFAAADSNKTPEEKVHDEEVIAQRKKAIARLNESLEKAAVEYKINMKNFFGRNVELDDLLY